MKLFTNPAVMQMIGMLFVVCGVLAMGLIIWWKLRKDIVGQPREQAPREESVQFATAAFQGVIATLRQREKYLQAQLTTEQRRFAALENTQQRVLENINSGILVFSSGLLVQQANAAARKLLGFGSPSNMHVSEVFRGLQTVELPSTNGALGGVSQALRDVFSTGAEYRNVPATYSMPSGEKRELHLAMLPMQPAGQPVASVLCVLECADTAFTLSFPAGEADKKGSKAE